VTDLAALSILAAIAALTGAWQVLTSATGGWPLAGGIALAVVGAAYAVLAVLAVSWKEKPCDDPDL
jgi:hypothetical protein